MNTASATVTSKSAAPALLPSLATTVGIYFAARLCLTFLFFQSNPQRGTVLGLALNILLLLVAIFNSFGPTRGARFSPWRVASIRWVAAFLAFSFCSLFWTQAVSVPVALAYWCGMAADVAIALLLLRSGPLVEIATSMMQGYVVGACFIACVMWLSPTMQDLRLGNDEFFSPNLIGFTCAFGIFLAELLMVRSKSWRYPAIFLAISLLRSLSKTTIIAFLLSQTLLLIFSTTIRRRSKVLIVTAAGLMLAAFSGLIAAYYQVYTNSSNQAETLTGRIGIWAFILDRALERPWFGNGFDSVWKVIPPFGTDQFEAWHAHNELLQQFYSYGIVGIVLLVGLYWSFCTGVRRVARPEHRALLLSLVAFIVIRGLGDTERFDLSFPLWSITLLGLMLSAQKEPAEGPPWIRLPGMEVECAADISNSHG
jgi:exopolysaccharide production protein ExoQ